MKRIGCPELLESTAILPKRRDIVHEMRIFQQVGATPPEV